MDYIECPCARCALKDPLLSRISRNLCRKHVKKHGLPIPTAAAAARPRTRSSARPEGSSDREGSDRRISTGIDIESSSDDDGHFEVGTGNGDEEPRPHEDRDRDPPPLPRPRAVAPDTEFREVKMPEAAELSLDPDFASGVAPTFRLGEIPGVRLAYLQAVYLNAMNNMSVKATTENLDMSLNILAFIGLKALDGVPIPGPNPCQVPNDA
ncbi:hypothetical protein LENED_002430 [Lentinula edodes]|uniref:Uncharacterized protein n=1 Tax=Lentinula edodes TaxID=5353 RepID=A0A1Q3E0V1_LENED|nr:hypothetical protein LENED_002430 [Lentinula edodes]